MIEKPPFAASGQAGYDFGVYRTQAPNARLYDMIPTLVRGSVNYVLFSPVSICDYDPDIIITVANTKSDIIMRQPVIFPRIYGSPKLLRTELRLYAYLFAASELRYYECTTD